MEIYIDNFVNTTSTTGVRLNLTKFAKIIGESFSSKVPVIAIYGDLSFIFIYDENVENYKTFKDWNGICIEFLKLYYRNSFF